MAMDPTDPNYQSLLSLIVMAIFGRGWFFHFTMWSVFLALCLSANTAFADFPRLTRAIAMRDYLRMFLPCAGDGCSSRTASTR